MQNKTNLPSTIKNYSIAISAVVPENDFRTFWKASPGIYASWFYPFHTHLIVETSLNISYHQKKTYSIAPAGFVNPQNDLRLFTFALTGWFNLNDYLPKPLVGINNFLAIFDKWYDIDADADEQELGFHFGIAYNYRLNKNIMLSTDARRYYVASTPRYIYYEIFKVGIIYTWEDKK